MKTLAFIKGLKLIFERRKELLKTVDLTAIILYIFAIVLDSSAVAIFFMTDSAALIQTFLHPCAMRFRCHLLGGEVSLHFSSGFVWVASVLAFCILGCLMFIISVLFRYVYKMLIDGIVADKPQAANHGDTIANVLRNLRYEPVEYLAAFTYDGNKIGESTIYSTREVRSHDDVQKAVFAQKGCIKIHNHPSSGSGFSGADFAAAITQCVSKTIVVAQDFVYTLELPPDCWSLDGEQVKQQFNQACEYYWKLNKKSNGRNRANFILGINVMLAQQLGMKLTVEKFKDCQYLKIPTTEGLPAQEADTARAVCSSPSMTPTKS